MYQYTEKFVPGHLMTMRNCTMTKDDYAKLSQYKSDDYAKKYQYIPVQYTSTNEYNHIVQYLKLYYICTYSLHEIVLGSSIVLWYNTGTIPGNILYTIGQKYKKQVQIVTNSRYNYSTPMVQTWYTHSTSRYTWYKKVGTFQVLDRYLVGTMVQTIWYISSFVYSTKQVLYSLYLRFIVQFIQYNT